MSSTSRSYEELYEEIVTRNPFAEDMERELSRLNYQAIASTAPTPVTVLLQVRNPVGGRWIDIYPSQLSWMAKEGFEVRAIEVTAQADPVLDYGLTRGADD